jgi:hypothetical protein
MLVGCGEQLKIKACTRDAAGGTNNYELMLASQWPASGIFLGPQACDAPVRLAVP